MAADPTWDLTALLNAADPAAPAVERHLWLMRLLQWLRHPAPGARVPAIGRRPTHTSTVEVFPAPLGPTRAVTWPAGASKVRPETAERAPYRTTRSRTVTAGSGTSRA